MNKIKILGPCSAESFEQLKETLDNLISSHCEFDYFRAGVWKPRTKPNGFEGFGAEALKWMKELKDTYKIKIITEVSSKEHFEQAIKHGIDAIWIGARTSGNPFIIEEIASVIKEFGFTDIPVFIKNPLHPDINSWIGAIERFHNHGILNTVGIYRGFSVYPKTKYRYDPLWELLKVMKEKMPNLNIILDPSHIAGDIKLIKEVIKSSKKFDLQGYMIEIHSNPKLALSDSSQQIEAKNLSKYL